MLLAEFTVADMLLPALYTDTLGVELQHDLEETMQGFLLALGPLASKRS